VTAENPTLPARRRTASRSAARSPRGRRPEGPSRPPPGRLRRAAWPALLGVLCVLLVLVGAALAERLAYRGRVLPGVEVGGLHVAGRSTAAARAAISARGRVLATEPVVVRIDGREVAIPAAGVGARIDADATVRAARGAGRPRNPIAQITGVVLRRLRPDRTDLALSVDEAGLRRSLGAVTTSRGVVDGDLRFEGTRVIEVAPRAGRGVDPDTAAATIERALRRGSRGPVPLPTGRVEPAVDRAAVARAAAHARAILAAPVVVDAPTPTGTVTATLSPTQVASVLGTRARGGQLEVTADASALRPLLGPTLAAVEAPPRDAGFAVQGNNVSVVPSTPGRTVDLASIAGAIARGEHRVTAAVHERQPEHDTAWAQQLGITELVSSFTTYFPCCQPRVTNIRTAVAALDGAIVEPGEVFSLNGRLGARTPEKGYVKAPAIAGDLSYFEDYGGGVSQVSTTLFNATFFGGYEDVSHTAHGLYISRYPMGREATINWPGLDNKFRNNSGSGVLVKAYATSTSVTVSYYGNKEGRSVRAEGPHVLETIEPVTEYVDDPTVPPGEEREVQSGYRGYLVENFRIISRPGRADVRQRFVVRYRMRPRKIARAPAPAAAPAPPPGAPGGPAAPPPPASVPATPGG